MNVTRWARFGKDRLYVRSAEGADIGWWDLATDEAHPQDPDLAVTLAEAVAQWRVEHQGASQHKEARAQRRDASPRLAATAAASDLPRPGEREGRVDGLRPEHEQPAPRRVEARQFTLDRQPDSTEASAPTPGPDFLPPPGGPPLGAGLGVSDSRPAQQASWSDVPSVAVGPVSDGPQRNTNFPPPQGPPVVADLLFNTPGQQLAGQIEEAHRNGQTPTLLRRFILGKHAYSTWERGAIGERLVADELARLVTRGPRWGFINSVPVGDNGSDIDLVVIGPGGVFTINAKYHQGSNVWVGGNTVMVNGTKVPYVRNSRFEAKRAGRLLSQACGISVHARGVVVPVNEARFVVREQPADVQVVNRKALVRFLQAQPHVLDADSVVTVFQFARLSSTWSPQ